MPAESREVFPDFTEPYAYRETPAQVWRNRTGVTGTLFAVAMLGSYLLGRPRD